MYLYISRYICIVKYIIENMVLSVIKLRIFLDVFEGSVTFSSKIKKISADHPPGPVIGRRDIEVLCDWATVYSPLLLAEL